MKRRVAVNGIAGVLACLWYGMIWRFSAQPATQSGQVSDGLLHDFLLRIAPSYGGAVREVQIAAMEILSFYERKAAHMFLYFVLAVLIWLAVFGWKKRPGLWYGVAMVMCAALAAVDEYHQTLVPGRSGEVRDVLVDLGGAAVAMIGLALVRWGLRFRRTRRFQRRWNLLIPAGIAILLFFVLWKDLGLLRPFAFRALNGGIDLFAPLSRQEQMDLLKAASPVLRETMSLAACALLGCCSAAAGLLSGSRQVLVPALLWGAVPAVVICALFGLAVGLALVFALSGGVLVLGGWCVCDGFFRWTERFETL